MAGKTLPSWNEINAAASSQGLNMSLWEDSLHDRLIEGILIRTKSVDKYMQDAVMHAEMERLVGIIVGILLEQSPLVDPKLRKRAADFDALFQQGAQEGRPPT